MMTPCGGGETRADVEDVEYAGGWRTGSAAGQMLLLHARRRAIGKARERERERERERNES